LKTTLLLFSLLCTTLTLLAQDDSKQISTCGQSFDKKISKGDKTALQSYIQECHQKPNKRLLQQYQIQTYTTLQTTSLVCMGDYYAPRITRISYLAYSLAAKQESLAAKVSLGVMLNKRQFKSNLLLSSSAQKHYKELAKNKHPYNYYEMLLQLRALSNKQEIKHYKKKYQYSTLKYVNYCISSLETDLTLTQREAQKYHHIRTRNRNHDTELWADTLLHFTQTKQIRLEKALKSFKTLASAK